MLETSRRLQLQRNWLRVCPIAVVYLRGCLSATLTLFALMGSLGALPHIGFKTLVETQDEGFLRAFADLDCE